VNPPELTVVIAARDAARTLPACLEAILEQAGPEVEVLVVDDCSSDDTREVAARFAVRLIALPEHLGVAGARNRGARAARAPILFFFDADVVAAPGTLARGRSLLSDLAVDAAIGSYDDEPRDRSMVSQFKNLAHHYFHQRSAPCAGTFWGACGVIRRDRFLAVGGFDERRYRLPSIEDVELGYRLVEAGARIRLDPGLQVKHLKRWTLGSLVKTDLLRRAIPWTLLWLERGGRLPRDLNFGSDQRVAAALAPGMVALAAAAVALPAAAFLLAACIAAAVWINRDLYRLLLRKGGARLAAGGFLLQQLYYLYSAVGLGVGVSLHCWRQLRRQARTVTGVP
jgi:GT2 family glycosyltransferase